MVVGKDNDNNNLNLLNNSGLYTSAPHTTILKVTH